MRVAIIHPWFPRYRESFFRDVKDQGNANGIELDIFHGSTPPEWQARGDTSVSGNAVHLRTKFIRVGNRHINYKRLGEVKNRAPYELVIVEQAIRNLETYRLLVDSTTRVAFWGHGRTYTIAKNPLEESLKTKLTNKGEWFFGYTSGGVEAVVANGFPANRTTVVQNAIDTAGLSDGIAQLSATTVAQWRAEHRIHGPMALFIGGLDESKRLQFLIDAADKVATDNVRFTLVIVGDGVQRNLLQDLATTRPWLRVMGPLFGTEKALVLKAADFIAMPGRVGLVSVDSFVASAPILTTNWKYHAPEFEYIKSGFNGLITNDSVSEYAASMKVLLTDSAKLRLLGSNCALSAKQYSTQEMARRFIGGLQAYATIGSRVRSC